LNGKIERLVSPILCPPLSLLPWNRFFVVDFFTRSWASFCAFLFVPSPLIILCCFVCMIFPDTRAPSICHQNFFLATSPPEKNLFSPELWPRFWVFFFFFFLPFFFVNPNGPKDATDNNAPKIFVQSLSLAPSCVGTFFISETSQILSPPFPGDGQPPARSFSRPKTPLICRPPVFFTSKFVPSFLPFSPSSLPPILLIPLFLSFLRARLPLTGGPAFTVPFFPCHQKRFVWAP